MADKIETIITTKGAGASSLAFKSIGTSVIALNQGLELLGKAMQALSAPFDAIIQEGREFGAQMSAVKAVASTTEQQFKMLRDEAQRLGETTAFSALQAGEAMEELGRAGQAPQQIIETTGHALNLAAANAIDLASSAELLAIQMNVFQKEGLQAQRAADLINQTISASPQNFEQFRYAMQYAGQAASAFNRDFEETTQIIGAMAETGVRGTQAGTALSAALAKLAKPTAEARKVLDEYGIALEQINPATNKFADIIDVLNKANLKQHEIISLLGLETAPKFFSIIEKGGDTIRNFALKQQEANTALEAAEIRLDNLDGDITLFQSAVSGLKLAIFENLDTILRSIVQGATAMTGAFTEFIRNNKGAITGVFDAMAAAMGKVKSGIEFLIRGFGHLLEAIGHALGTAEFARIVGSWSESFRIIGAALDVVWPIIQKVASAVGKLLLNSFLIFADVLSTTVLVAIEQVRDFLLGLPVDWQKVVDWIHDVIDDFDDLVGRIAQIEKTSTADELANNLERSQNALVELTRSNAASQLAAIVENLERGFRALYEIFGILPSFSVSLEDLTISFSDFLRLISNVVLDAFLKPVRMVTTAIRVGLEGTRDAIQGIPKLFTAAKNIIVGAIDAIVDGVTRFVEAMEKIGSTINDAMKSFLQLGENAIFKAILGLKNFVIGGGKALKTVEDLDHALTGNSLVPSFAELSEKVVESGKRFQTFTFEAEKAKKQVKALDKQVEQLQKTGGGGVVSLSGLSDAGSISSIFKSLQKGGIEFARSVKDSIMQSIEEFEIPFGAIFSKIGAVFARVVDSIWALFNSNEKFKAALNKVSATVAKVVAPVIEAFAPVLDALSDSIEELAPFFKDIADDLAPLVQDLIEFVTDLSKAVQPIVKTLVSKLVPLIQRIVEQIGPVLIKLTETLGPVIENLLDILIPIVEELLPILVEILGLFAELNPLIAAILEVIKPFVPIIRVMIKIIATWVSVLVNILKPIIQVVTNVLKLLAGAIQALFNLLEGVFKPIFEGLKNILNTLVSAIEGLGKSLLGGLGGGGGGGGGGFLGLPGLPKIGGGGGFFGFQQGTGALTKDQLVRLPGMEPNAGLVKAHVGESIGAGGAQPMNITFNIKAIDPKATAAELRQLLEELRATGKL